MAAWWQDGEGREIIKQEVLNKLTKSSLQSEGAIKPEVEREE